MASLEAQFEAASKHFEGIVGAAPDRTKLTMYALWNQAKSGDVDLKTEPSRMDMVKYYKFQARKKVRGMTKEQAMKRYVQELRQLDPAFVAAGGSAAADDSKASEEDEDEDAVGGKAGISPALLAGANKSEVEKVRPTFERAVAFARDSGLFRSEATRSLLYALYKQSTVGPCTKPAPSLLLGRKRYARWRAWANLFDMAPHEAMRQYVETVRKMAPEFESKDPAYFDDSSASRRFSASTAALMSAGPASQAAASTPAPGPRPTTTAEILDAVDRFKATQANGVVYFVTGATGFIGKRVVKRVLQRAPGSLVLCLARTPVKIAQLFPADPSVIGVGGDVSKPGLGMDPGLVKGLVARKSIAHVFHLAAVYDLKATKEMNEASNVQGTREVVNFCNQLGSGVALQYTSSIAVAGDFDGIFTEDMFSEGQTFDAPYLETKFRAEKVVRDECQVPYRVYRPGLVVGSSETGEMDKIDGPYYLFKPIQRLKRWVPSVITLPIVAGETVPLVPVDFVVNAVVHIAHKKGLDKKAFHLVDPNPPTFEEMVNIFSEAADGPSFSSKLSQLAMSMIPAKVWNGLNDIPILADAPNTVGANVLGVPDTVVRYTWNKTTFDVSNTQEALRGSGIRCPALKDYGWRLWDYYARFLDPAVDKFGALTKEVAGKVAVVTGSSDGIGEVLARRLAKAGARVVLVARSKEKLEVVQKAILAEGGQATIVVGDLSDKDSTYKAANEILKVMGRVDLLVNNAGRSIRRSVAYQCGPERFHDFTRTMDLNAYGALRMSLSLLPGMRDRKEGQIINVSSIGCMTGPPRFGAYVASKAYLDAWARCVAGEVAQDNVVMSTVYIPLTRTKMVVSKANKYEHVRLYTPEQSSGLIERAIVTKERKVMTSTAWWTAIAYFVNSSAVESIMNLMFRLEPEAPPEGVAPLPNTVGDKEQLKKLGSLFSGTFL